MREVAGLWQTDELRRQKPTPVDGAPRRPCARHAKTALGADAQPASLFGAATCSWVCSWGTGPSGVVCMCARRGARRAAHCGAVAVGRRAGLHAPAERRAQEAHGQGPAAQLHALQVRAVALGCQVGRWVGCPGPRWRRGPHAGLCVWRGARSAAQGAAHVPVALAGSAAAQVAAGTHTRTQRCWAPRVCRAPRAAGLAAGWAATATATPTSRPRCALARESGRENPPRATVVAGPWPWPSRARSYTLWGRVPCGCAQITKHVSCLARWMAADMYLKEVRAVEGEDGHVWVQRARWDEREQATCTSRRCTGRGVVVEGVTSKQGTRRQGKGQVRLTHGYAAALQTPRCTCLCRTRLSRPPSTSALRPGSLRWPRRWTRCASS